MTTTKHLPEDHVIGGIGDELIFTILAIHQPTKQRLIVTGRAELAPVVHASLFHYDFFVVRSHGETIHGDGSLSVYGVTSAEEGNEQQAQEICDSVRLMLDDTLRDVARDVDS